MNLRRGRSVGNIEQCVVCRAVSNVGLDAVGCRCIIDIFASMRTVGRTHGGVSIDNARFHPGQSRTVVRSTTLTIRNR